MRRHAANLVIIVLALAAVAIWVFYDRGSVSTDEALGRRSRVLPVFRSEDITEFTVTSGGRSARVVRGQTTDAGQNPWEVEIDGARWPAEEPVVDQYLVSLREGAIQHEVRGGIDRPSFGLDRPRARVEVAMGPQRLDLAIGGKAPRPEGAVYAEIKGGKVMVITAQLAAVIDRPLDDFRSKTLVPVAPSDLQAFSLEGSGGSRRMVRGSWPIGRGAGFRFDGAGPEGKVRVRADTLDKVWEALGQLKAEAFLKDKEADLGWSKKLTVTMTPVAGKGAPVVLELGGACPGHADDVVVIRRSPGPRVSACAPDGVLEALTRPADDFVDKRAVGAPADEVVDLKLASGEKGEKTELAMARQGASWHEQAPVDRVIEADVGRRLLDRITAVEGDKIEPEGKVSGAPIAVLRVASSVSASEGGERIEEIEVFGDEGGTTRVRRKEDGVVLVLPTAAASALRPGDLDLRSRKVFDESKPTFTSLRIDGPGGAQKLERDHGEWKILEPQARGLVADAALVGHVTDTMASLEAERWVGEPRPEHGLDRPRLVIKVGLEGGKTLEVALGAAAAAMPPAAAGVFARAAGDPAVFVAPKALSDAAEQWLLDRTVLLPDFVSLTKATLVVGQSKVGIELENGAYRIAGSKDGASAARAVAIHDALDGLLADGTASIGAPEKSQGFDAPALSMSVETTGPAKTVTIGGKGVFRGQSVYYARREGVDATFALAEPRVRALLDAVSR